MSSPLESADDLYPLLDAAVEGTLSPEQAAQLERRVLDDPAARRTYVEYLHAHACLQWSSGQQLPTSVEGAAELPMPAAEEDRLDDAAENHNTGALGSLRRRLTWNQSLPFLVSSAVMLLIGAGLGMWSVKLGGSAGNTASSGAGSAPAAVARLEAAKSCKWENGRLPTEPGTELPPGRLRLAEGLARIRFASGAEVVLEGPADLELMGENRCTLYHGKLIGRVVGKTSGFTVDTPLATVIDLGTEFGVNVARRNQTDVQVFDGMVDLVHRRTGNRQRLTAGAAKRCTVAGTQTFDPLVAEKGSFDGPEESDQATALVHISAADGNGKDSFIQSGDDRQENFGAETLLQVKNTLGPTHRRKGYVGFDLTALEGREVDQATLSFTIEPTGLGFAAVVPDATFTVYGLIDESLDSWGEDDITWDNAPANESGGGELDRGRTVRLGSFTVAQGVRSGVRTVTGPSLVRFLNEDTNGTATLILVRDTVEGQGAGLVHGFASRQHPSSDPPSLRLLVRE